MKIAVLTARVLLGLLFFVFGLNNILHFMKMEMPTGDAGIYLGVLATHGILNFVGVLMVIAGLLLLVGRYVPLALVILGPLIVNILMFHFMIAHFGAAPGVVALVLEAFLIWAYRFSFRGLFEAAPESSRT